MILKALIVLIEADTPLSQRLASRIYARQAPQNVAAPYAVLNRVSRAGVETLDGPSAMARRRIQRP